MSSGCLFHFESCFLQIIPVGWIGFGDYLRLVYPDVWQGEAGWGKCHGHAVVFVGGNNGGGVFRATFAVPQQDAVLLGAYNVTQFAQFRNEGGDTVSLLYFEALQAGEAERNVHQAAGDDKGLCQIGDVHHVFVETGGGNALPGQFYSRFVYSVWTPRRAKTSAPRLSP